MDTFELSQAILAYIVAENEKSGKTNFSLKHLKSLYPEVSFETFEKALATLPSDKPYTISK